MVFARVVEIVYSTTDVWSNAPSALILSSLLVGGIVVLYVLCKSLETTFIKPGWKRMWAVVTFDPKSKRSEWIALKGHYFAGIMHTIFQTVFFAGCVFIIWVSLAMIGVNPATSSAASLGLSIFLTYGLANPVTLLISGYIVDLRTSIAEGEHWEFHGMGPEWAGRIIQINWMDVVMERYNKTTRSAETIVVPKSYFLNNVRKLNWHMNFAEDRSILPETDLDEKLMKML
jgi:hypothetical protein